MGIYLGPAPGLTEQECADMGFTPPPMPRVSRPAEWPTFKSVAQAQWNHDEAVRELQAYLLGIPYTYQPPPEEWFVPGVGYVRPPHGGSSVQSEEQI